MSKFLCRLGIHQWANRLQWSTETNHLVRYTNICRRCGKEDS